MISKKQVTYTSNNISYPTSNYCFSPSINYPEYQYNDIATEENLVYDAVREAFRLQGLDPENFGSRNWNPLKDIISENQVVLIKPNWVNHTNPEPQYHDMNCLVTHPSVVRAVIDYVLIALNGTGRIIVADAPVQSCNYQLLHNIMGYDKLWEYYSTHNVNVSHIDMRGKITISHKHGLKQTVRELDNGIIVKLNTKSLFAQLDNSTMNKLRITNYPTYHLKSHHNEKTHEYSIHPTVLNADVIINIPKPKSHRKAGMTGAMKNMIGVCARKEYLPHHTQGSFYESGDEYLNKNFFLLKSSKFLDKYYNASEKNIGYFYKKISNLFYRIGNMLTKDAFKEGNWYGNDTIWRTILDLNNIVMYANKQGEMTNIAQRTLFTIADMIVVGQNEGPLRPTPKHLGMILIGLDASACDCVIAKIFGFNPIKIKYLSQKFQQLKNDIIVKSSHDINTLNNLNTNTKYSIVPTSGWKGHIEL